MLFSKTIFGSCIVDLSSIPDTVYCSTFCFSFLNCGPQEMGGSLTDSQGVFFGGGEVFPSDNQVCLEGYFYSRDCEPLTDEFTLTLDDFQGCSTSFFLGEIVFYPDNVMFTDVEEIVGDCGEDPM